MADHPLVLRSEDPQVRKAKGFREAAAEITGETLAAEIQQEAAGAPRRADAGKKFLVAPNKRLAAERNPKRDSEHAAIALVTRQASGAPPLDVPGSDGSFEALHAGVVLKSAPADKAAGPSDPNYGIDKIDLLGIGPEDRMALAVVRFVAPSATRVGTGETPLRTLLAGLAHLAVAQANRDAIVAELEASGKRTPSAEPPYLFFLGSPRYWELCRKREAQRGAAWIREMERLATELQEHAGISVRYLSLGVDGDPGWSYQDGGPVFDAEPQLLAAWEPLAGRVKPKPRKRPRKDKAPSADDLVEADLTRPVRSYATTEVYSAGDRIDHPTLGLGVVQGGEGPTKIYVLFEERKSVLVHSRSQ